MSEPTTEQLVAILKSGEYDGVYIMKAWCRLRQLQQENEALRAEREYLFREGYERGADLGEPGDSSEVWAEFLTEGYDRIPMPPATDEAIRPLEQPTD